MTRSRNYFVSALGSALVILGSSAPTHSTPQNSAGVVVTARAPLEPISEARKLVADMEREVTDLAKTSNAKIETSQLHPGPPEIATGIRRISDGFPSFLPNSGNALVLRTEKSLEAVVLAQGLRAGVYTMWWVVFNHPDRCSQSQPELHARCGGGDGSDLRLDDASILWATGAVVGADGIGLFHAKTEVDGDRGTPGKEFVRGADLIAPLDAEVHFVIKYNGRASKDVDELSKQLISMPNLCLNASGALDLDSIVAHCSDVRAGTVGW